MTTNTSYAERLLEGNPWLVEEFEKVNLTLDNLERLVYPELNLRAIRSSQKRLNPHWIYDSFDRAARWLITSYGSEVSLIDRHHGNIPFVCHLIQEQGRDRDGFITFGQQLKALIRGVVMWPDYFATQAYEITDTIDKALGGNLMTLEEYLGVYNASGNGDDDDIAYAKLKRIIDEFVDYRAPRRMTVMALLRAIWIDSILASFETTNKGA